MSALTTHPLDGPPRAIVGPRLARLAGLARASRPLHWVKNLACFAGVVSSARPTSAGAVSGAFVAFAAFCLASSAVYLFNDVVDQDRDRLDSSKKGRPVASGMVPSAWALAGSFGFGLAALGVSTWLVPRCLALLFAYLTINVAYSLRLKHEVRFDVPSLALGFVIRVLFGFGAVGVEASAWVVLCTFSLASFLAIAKRRHELGRGLEGGSTPIQRRPVLASYDLRWLDRMLAMTGMLAVVSYALVSISGRPDGSLLVVTVPIVAFGVIRYWVFVQFRGEGGSPETCLVTDRVLMATVVGWLVASLAILHGPNFDLFGR